MFGSKLEIKRFEKSILQYEEQPVKKGLILLYGHSLFTRCKPGNRWGHANVEEHVLAKDGSQAILNHGFGTSSADDLLYYYHRMVTPYEPRALLLATGNNDFAAGYSADEVIDIQTRLVQYARAEFPDIPIYCFSLIPTQGQKVADEAGVARRNRYNTLLQELCDKMNCTYVSLVDLPVWFDNPEDVGYYEKVGTRMYGDRSHLNSEGYLQFMDFLRELLDPLL